MSKILFLAAIVLAMLTLCACFSFTQQTPPATDPNHDIRHDITEQNTSEKFLKSPATCSARAVYYYSCSCGEIGESTFEYGEPDPNAHTFEQKNTDNKYLKTPANCHSPAVYCYSCSDCGAMGTQTFNHGSVDPTLHVYDQKVISSDYLHSNASTESNALYYYSCICGAKGDKTFERIPIPGDEHEYTSACDTFCNVCGKVRNTTVDHIPSDENAFICKVCGETIGKENWTEPDTFG